MVKEKINLKVGDICILRNGLKTPPLQLSNNGTNYRFTAKVQEEKHPTPSCLSWRGDGKYLTAQTNHDKDIIGIV